MCLCHIPLYARVSWQHENLIEYIMADMRRIQMKPNATPRKFYAPVAKLK